MGAPLPVDRVVAGILEDVAARESRTSFQEIKRLSTTGPEPRDAAAAILRSGCGVVAEIKRKIPPTGADVPIDSVGDIASLLEDSGVHMVACQTEKLRFAGSLEDMSAARHAVELPMMCRDIIVDPYQIHEARYYGADMVPLQVELLDQARLISLIDRIESLGMTALAEVRTPEEADRALDAGCRVIGVNAWSINNSRIDRENFAAIVPGLPQDVLRIALGGVRTSHDLLAYAAAGADAVLVGESIMSAADPAGAARTLVATGQHPACPTR
ncbi:indole-3-glycerol-phosphate synthase TrpC [Corynebacterium yudongzhengii]|uniref:indole-3-glycerol-phosphate synthase n=1 Tax=Corynebacterium yudongzhengii TaxID=2080740 RepID=A0A2U1T6K4_9CORY|nr:orotidine 5'-phosphate decarboxylase / HUMPS family protein [Corynebacterium yudongzhengii]AWB81618.1 indole-3-glycerol-phosphate synthase TrpC [Corynebacterium yudongzhengii]PWC01603.1 indole-3-glycerol-phosphate synthase TrpC [Corynebacterium yudongzhengii]